MHCPLLLLVAVAGIRADTWLGPNDALEETFGRLDANNDSIVDVDEFFFLQKDYIDATMEHFLATDLNEDRNITLEEMIAREAIKQVNGDPLASPFKGREHFYRLDKDGDGLVSFTEYLRRDPHFTEEILEVMRHVDADGDQKLTLGEFLSFPQREAARMKQFRRKNFELVFNQVDSNKDGKVDVDELRDYVANGFYPKKTIRVSAGLSELAKTFDADQSGAFDVEELFEFKERNPYTEMECIISARQ
ncbi:hypothetical protein QR680_011052 [Steinernema hermaphroditum]|uniref:EF-hand domain-containing protein n=1 Tax=Steinernema hermaphroditum TaxID=289476 RepID=A0AA39ISG0_9BILA|nr:hypothetical protein QR680_011052 [Steinernema hermaphroditum]